MGKYLALGKICIVRELVLGHGPMYKDKEQCWAYQFEAADAKSAEVIAKAEIENKKPSGWSSQLTNLFEISREVKL